MEEMKFTQSTLPDLLQYKDRHGFIFKGQTQSGEKSIENLCRSLIPKGVAVTMPELVAFLPDNTFAAVYPEGISFESGDFYRRTCHNPFGLWAVDILGAALRNFELGLDLGEVLVYNEPHDSTGTNSTQR
jgi:hypothetical protein